MNPLYPCRATDFECLNTSSFFVPQAVMTYANVDYDPANVSTLISSLDLLWEKSNQCNRASPVFWLVRDCSDAMLVLGIALFAWVTREETESSRLCRFGCSARHSLSVQKRACSSALMSSVALELCFLFLRLCADLLALANNEAMFCCLGMAYFLETDLCVFVSGFGYLLFCESARPCTSLFCGVCFVDTSFACTLYSRLSLFSFKSNDW